MHFDAIANITNSETQSFVGVDGIYYVYGCYI